ncbi:UDP-N-acetylmuramoyl-L-alanine--D-glutamate ligase [Paenibacillus apiarius]|uniref:UDP-N-acetylmuramoylalanine--D-glutamate ligase n=1 Tax=Paenibacillus apiarius TaxID=46240 RepID=A0ABT4DLB0_9BACL|nr:UDP-N-acetylmuramoyl-L-alanine--D-glutamate ligase [Paenibacillus apiarius]MCY9513585.1 UDP-N-acetylmuramoyl-L-alanine--D-glutamate ligase [Paenibacillus apiarius]MCY9518136.1 UDP-N-acetylmuramoyl-L-alanine--D-glutamate ligase [Paenibacillus apiarius]MCY9551463.1 UDP-N-acetylmuramoyl-L-alanine--D-glutamate ligase [Paenibacillus apiarius]MCY9558617.1 UDP-N-acetylmuramoyl-L-alanine--D-glutamate ligase [Paenibacillus apiarius]MCY9684069.1 UDP-N-acetylmuramoyl-L-alanine--D-glutamate ligase [Pae
MNHPESYEGQRVVVLGLAKSGVRVAKIFHDRGAQVTVNDKKERHMCPEASELEALGICVVCGHHPDELIDEQVALVVKNPGIPYSAPPVMKAISLGIEVVTEVEVAYRLSPAPIVGITGSNGKTTTTTWVGNMLEAAGLKPVVAGNIGTPLCQAAEEVGQDDILVVELSSFQLKGTDQFHPRVACLLNVAETHLDYHGTMEDYVSSKARLFENMTEQDVAVLNADDETCRSLASRIQARKWWVSSNKRVDCGVFIDPPYGDAAGNDESRHLVYVDEQGMPHPIVRVQEIGLPGRYNVDNALAACAIAIAAGASPDSLAEPLRAFNGVEHRLEFVRKDNGVVYYNNSKATNTKATLMALEAFDGNIVLIAGGLDRGLDFHELIPVMRERVKAVVTMGQTRRIMEHVAAEAGLSDIAVVDNMDNASAAITKAVQLAQHYAEAGDIVLLSPACASWDMFPSYEERGRMFKAAVHSL